MYAIYWDIGHDCGVFSERYVSEEDAQAAADAIQAERRALGAWDEDCTCEVVPVDDLEDEMPPHQIEGTLAHFDRYVTGDR